MKCDSLKAAAKILRMPEPKAAEFVARLWRKPTNGKWRRFTDEDLTAIAVLGVGQEMGLSWEGLDRVAVALRSRRDGMNRYGLRRIMLALQDGADGVVIVEPQGFIHVGHPGEAPAFDCALTFSLAKIRERLEALK